MSSMAIIFASLSFWFGRVEMITNTLNHLMVNFATYPDGIFKGIAKIILYTIVPVGIATYLPVNIIRSFNIYYFMIVIGVCLVMIAFAYLIFYKGLRRYSSSNLMISRI
jgi:ABC-2 type transport system permease protein